MAFFLLLFLIINNFRLKQRYGWRQNYIFISIPTKKIKKKLPDIPVTRIIIFYFMFSIRVYLEISNFQTTFAVKMS